MLGHCLEKFTCLTVLWRMDNFSWSRGKLVNIPLSSARGALVSMPFCPVSNICDTVIRPFSSNIILSAGVNGKSTLSLEWPYIGLVPHVSLSVSCIFCNVAHDWKAWDRTRFLFLIKRDVFSHSFGPRLRWSFMLGRPASSRILFVNWNKWLSSSLYSSFLNSFWSRLICSPSTVVCGSGICSPPFQS